MDHRHNQPETPASWKPAAMLTPGPWALERVIPNPGRAPLHFVRGPNGERVARVLDVADAPLLLAAPDLYAAARALIDGRDDAETWERLRAAVAAAESEDG